MLPDYSASDEKLRLAVLTALAADQRTAGVTLRVGVLNSIVHLAGAMDTLANRQAAEEVALRVEGVRGVVNRIDAPGAPSPARTVNLDLGAQSKNTNLGEQ